MHRQCGFSAFCRSLKNRIREKVLPNPVSVWSIHYFEFIFFRCYPVISIHLEDSGAPSCIKGFAARRTMKPTCSSTKRGSPLVCWRRQRDNQHPIDRSSHGQYKEADKTSGMGREEQGSPRCQKWHCTATTAAKEQLRMEAPIESMKTVNTRKSPIILPLLT